VRWINHDDSPRILTGTDKSLRSPPLDSGDYFPFTFIKAEG